MPPGVTQPTAKFYISCNSITYGMMQHSTGWIVHMHHYSNAIQANKRSTQDETYGYLHTNT